MNAQYEFSDSKIELQAYSETYNASATQLIASEYGGEPFKIMLSIPMFSEALAKIPSQEVVLQFDENCTFVIMRPAQAEAEGVDYMIYLASMIL